MNRQTKNILWGLLLIVLAVCLILWKLNIFSLPVALMGVGIWGLIIAAVMLVILIHSLIRLSFGGIFFPLAILCIIFDDALGITALTPWTVLIAALLLTIACHFLFPKHGRHMNGHEKSEYFKDRFSENSSGEENGNIFHTMRFGSVTKYVRTPNLVSADLNAQFGEMSVFFDGAQVPGKRVTIRCQVSFGEMDVYIPGNWRIENRVSVSLGHCDDMTNYIDVTEEPVICIIEGSVSFGELKLIRI